MPRFGYEIETVAASPAADGDPSLASRLASGVFGVACCLAGGLLRGGPSPGFLGRLFRGGLFRRFLGGDAGEFRLLRGAAFSSAGSAGVAGRLQSRVAGDLGGVVGGGPGAETLQQGLFGGGGGTYAVVEIGPRVG